MPHPFSLHRASSRTNHGGGVRRVIVPIALVCVAGAFSTGVGHATTGGWTAQAPMPTARWGVAVVAVPDGRIFALGGTTTNGVVLNTVEAYTPTTNTWTAAAPMPTPRSSLAATVGPDGRIYAMGGVKGGYLNTVEVYTPSTNSWAAIVPMPTPRSELAAATANDGRIYTFGGSNGAALNTVEAYTPATNTWSVLPSLPISFSGAAATTGPDGRVYVMGGFRGTTPLSEVVAFTPSTGSWAVAASMTVARSGLAATTGTDGRIYALGGIDLSHSVVPTVEGYSVGTNSWTAVTSMPSARGALGAATGTDGRIYAIGGAGTSGPLSTAEAFDTGTAPPDSDLGLTGMPANVTTYAAGVAGSAVSYQAPTATDEAGDIQGPTVSCDHPSGSTFAITTTTVTCTASDGDDTPSSVSRTFTVSVLPDLQLGAGVSPEAATTGTVLTGGISTTNEGTMSRSVTVNATLSYVTASSTVNTVFQYKVTSTLAAGQTVRRSSTYRITAHTPRGSYVLDTSATDATGTVTSVAYFTIS
jgi:N-acetylneuraminic acid mutarotase